MAEPTDYNLDNAGEAAPPPEAPISPWGGQAS
jgi:hypothetical protein